MRKLAVRAKNFAGHRSRPDEQPGLDGRADRVEPILERRHHAEIAAAAADGPEQIRVLSLAGGDERPVGQDHVRFEQVVDRETVLAGEIAGAAAQGETRDACGRNDAERDRQPEWMSGVIDVTRGAAGLDANRLVGGIDPHPLHRRQVDHQSVVDAAEPGSTVAAAADGNEQALLAAVVNLS